VLSCVVTAVAVAVRGYIPWVDGVAVARGVGGVWGSVCVG
jgi:hypothetical protein